MDIFNKRHIYMAFIIVPFIFCAITGAWYVTRHIIAIGFDGNCGNTQTGDKLALITKIEKKAENYTVVTYTDRFGVEKTELVISHEHRHSIDENNQVKLLKNK